MIKNDFLIRSQSRVMKARGYKQLNEQLDKIPDYEWVTVHKDGKCIFDGYITDYRIDQLEIMHDFDKEVE